MTTEQDQQAQYEQYQNQLEQALAVILAPHDQVTVVNVCLSTVLRTAAINAQHGEPGLLEILEQAGRQRFRIADWIFQRIG